MATQAPSAALPASRDQFPPELVDMVVKEIPGYCWPDMWTTLRSLSWVWKREVERTFRRKYLPKITITVALLELLHHPKSRVVFEYDAEKSTEERAVLKLCKGTKLGRQDWQVVTHRLERGYTELRDSCVHMITVSDLCVVNNTELVGLHIDAKTQTLSFEWTPTMNQLFKEERKIRELARDDTETFCNNRGIAFYLMNKDYEYLVKLLCKVRELQSGNKSGLASTSTKYICLPKERVDLKLPKDCLSW